MAIFTFYCKECNQKYTSSQLDPEMKCELGHKLKRVFISPNVHVKETIDNGFQIKRIERPDGAVDLLRERNENSTKKN